MGVHAFNLYLFCCWGMFFIVVCDFFLNKDGLTNRPYKLSGLGSDFHFSVTGNNNT